jgi:hypothetical protein
LAVGSRADIYSPARTLILASRAGFIPRARVRPRPGRVSDDAFNLRPRSAGAFDSGSPDTLARGVNAKRSLLLQGVGASPGAIRDAGSLIIGQRDLDVDGIAGLREVSHRGGGTVWLYGGGLRLRPATAEESRTLPVISVWGRRFIHALAEKHFPRLDRRPTRSYAIAETGQHGVRKVQWRCVYRAWVFPLQDGGEARLQADPETSRGNEHLSSHR